MNFMYSFLLSIFIIQTINAAQTSKSIMDGAQLFADCLYNCFKENNKNYDNSVNDDAMKGKLLMEYCKENLENKYYEQQSKEIIEIINKSENDSSSLDFIGRYDHYLVVAKYFHDVIVEDKDRRAAGEVFNKVGQDTFEKIIKDADRCFENMKNNKTSSSNNGSWKSSTNKGKNICNGVAVSCALAAAGIAIAAVRNSEIVEEIDENGIIDTMIKHPWYSLSFLAAVTGTIASSLLAKKYS